MAVASPLAHQQRSISAEKLFEAEDDGQGGDETDGETRIVELENAEELINILASSERLIGFPDPPKPPTSIGERIARFFGVDKDQAELKTWRIRHTLALQGYLKEEFVPKLKEYETDEVDLVCFRVPETTPSENRHLKEEAFKHDTGRSLGYRDLCRPIPPRKDHVWVVVWLSLLSSFASVRRWWHDRGAQFKAFGHDMSGTFQSAINELKPLVNRTDGKGEKEEDIADGKGEENDDISMLTFFDDRTLPTPPSAARGDLVDGTAAERRQRKPSMSELYKARKAERGGATKFGRRGDRGIDAKFKNETREKHIGWISWLLGHTYKSSINTKTANILSDIYSYRPYFMFWASTVHILVLIVSLSIYGFAPVGVGNVVQTASVASVSGGSRIAEREVERNFWFGPTFTNLIHLGAKYGPCMRRDKAISDAILAERVLERDHTACCIRSDSQICYQSTAGQCTANFFQWLKWNGNATISGTRSSVVNVPSFTTPSLISAAAASTCTDNGTRCYRTSGSLCGQDPVSCQRPASQAPREWPDDISRWPVCTEVDPVLNVTTTSCEVTGRPCCVGKQGVCTIATKEHCDYVNGFYHEDKRLCSEVNCLEDTCGLTTFTNSDTPDQFYRLWTSLCIHVGVLHLALTLIVQMTVGRHIEKLIGWFRIGMIYVLSGIAGNLVSAVFVPYQAEVGPGAALFGLLATLVVDTVKERHLLQNFQKEFIKLMLIILFAFFLGTLPYIDNFAHLGGFVMGLLTSVLFVPYIGQSLAGVNNDRKQYSNKEKKWFRLYHMASMVVAFLAILAFFLLFFLLFYDVQPACQNCSYVNCIPLTPTLCKDLVVNVTTRTCYVCE